MKKLLLLVFLTVLHSPLWAQQKSDFVYTSYERVEMDMQTAMQNAPDFAWVTLVICALLLSISYFIQNNNSQSTYSKSVSS